MKKCTHEKDEFEVPFRVIHSNICVENCTIKLLNRKEMEFLTIKSLLEVFAKNNPKEPDLSALKLRFGGLKMRENGEYRILPFFGNKSFSEVMKIGSESDAKISTITITMDYDQEVTQNMRADIIAILREDVYESDSEMPILKKKDGECDELLAEGLSDSKDGYTKDGKGTCDELSGVVLTRSKVVDTTPDLHQRRRPFLDVEGSFAEDDLAFILDNDTGSK